MSLCFLLLAGFRERGYALQIANDASQIIQILAAALRTGGQTILTDEAAVVTNSVRDIKSKIRAAGLNRRVHQYLILFLCQMLIQIAMERRSAIEIARQAVTMQDELVDYIAIGIFYDVEVAVVAVAGNDISVLFIPRRILDRLCSDRFATPAAFSYELLHVAMQTRLYLRPRGTPPISTRLGVLPYGIVVEPCSIEPWLLIVLTEFPAIREVCCHHY